MKKLLALFTLFISTILCSFAQSVSNGPEMADKLRENGMFYIVVGVLLIILLGLLIYVIVVDRKISKLEQEVKSQDIK
jgi:hypothetical protein